MIDILIDELTNSIRNRLLNTIFETQVLLVTHSAELPQDWQFDWRTQSLQSTVYKLTTIDAPDVIQGLISLETQRGYIYINLVENAPTNLGKQGIYEGVGGNLFAFACQLSFKQGFEGFVAFDAKSSLINHYEKTLFAKRISSQRMIIDTAGAFRLIQSYFKTS